MMMTIYCLCINGLYMASVFAQMPNKCDNVVFKYLRNKKTMDNFNKEQFAKDIVLKRVLEKRISLRKAAKECDVHFSNLSRYERQEVEPTITHMLNICGWLDNDISKYLKTGNKEPEKQQSDDKTFAIYDVRNLACSDLQHKHYYFSTMRYTYCPHCGVLLEQACL